jgi:hypothetical protein
LFAMIMICLLIKKNCKYLFSFPCEYCTNQQIK